MVLQAANKENLMYLTVSVKRRLMRPSITEVAGFMMRAGFS